MADREKVIRGLECCSNGRMCKECPYDEMGYEWTDCVIPLGEDALSLLKAKPEIVRCRECIRRGTYDCPVYVGGDADHGSPDDWFCASGERDE